MIFSRDVGFFQGCGFFLCFFSEVHKRKFRKKALKMFQFCLDFAPVLGNLGKNIKLKKKLGGGNIKFDSTIFYFNLKLVMQVVLWL